MDLGIGGKTALVAGGSAGLGRASARALAAEGVRLFISARGEDRLRRAAAEIEAETGADVVAVVADHGTVEGREALADACPSPDILVISCSPPPFTEDYRKITVEDWAQAIPTTMLGPIELMRHYSGGMADRKFGRIVHIGTMAAKHPLYLRMLSGPTRSAVTNYAVALSKRVAKHNVVINSMLPGIFKTPGLDQAFEDAASANGTSVAVEADRFLRRWKIPAERYGDADDFGAMCAMLCSQYAGFTIGQSIVVDGGLGGGLF